MKKILFSIMAVGLAIGLMGGAFAYFSDTETSTGNTFTAGYVDLTITGGPWVITGAAPGQEFGPYTITYKNNGNLNGYLVYDVTIDGQADDVANNLVDVSAAGFADWVNISQATYQISGSGEDSGLLADWILAWGSGGKITLSQLAAPGPYGDNTEILLPGDTVTFKLWLTLDAAAPNSLQADGVVSSSSATLRTP